jgi:hypothetical protein
LPAAYAVADVSALLFNKADLWVSLLIHSHIWIQHLRR